MVCLVLSSFILLGSLDNSQRTYCHVLSNESEEIFISETITKLHKMTIFVYETLNNLLSNNCNYQKQMFLFTDKLYKLLFGCVIMQNKPTHINTNINRINCVISFNNITVNTPITESTCKSTYKSTNEFVRVPTFAPIIAQRVSTIQATHDANFTVAWSSDYSYRNITLPCGTDLATNGLKQCVIYRKRLDPAIQYLYVSNCNNVFCKCGIESDGCCEGNIYVDNGLNSECECNALYTTNNETNKGICNNLISEMLVFIGIVLTGICLSFIVTKFLLVYNYVVTETHFLGIPG